MPVKVAVYAGKPAVLAYEFLDPLRHFGLPFSFLRDEELVKLPSYDVLLVPGGYTGNYIPSMGSKGVRILLEFVEGGGGYVGVCAGAYVAGLLKLVKSEPVRVEGIGWVEIEVRKPDHPVMRGYSGKVRIHYQNGPHIRPAEGEESLATYADGSTAILSAKFGKGRVILFSPHPERSRSTWRMLLNALLYAAQL